MVALSNEVLATPDFLRLFTDCFDCFDCFERLLKGIFAGRLRSQLGECQQKNLCRLSLALLSRTMLKTSACEASPFDRSEYHDLATVAAVFASRRTLKTKVAGRKPCQWSKQTEQTLVENSVSRGRMEGGDE